MEISEAARHVIIGFEGLAFTPELDDLLRLGMGGVILFSRNYESAGQVADLIAQIKNHARCEEFIVAVDQEGGRVLRFKEPFTQWPPMRALGNMRDKAAARNLGRFLGEEMAAVGVNLNLAPVMDVDSNPDNPVIGDRSFGKDPKLVAYLGCEIIAGIQEMGLMACAKHFPGHGDTSEDSHHTLPVCEAEMELLKERELVPFEKAIRSGVASVMTAHVVYPAIDEEQPASLSKKAVNVLLRQKMGFQGIVLSDDLIMDAVSKDTAQTAVQAIAAGSDMVLVCNDPQRQEQAVAGLFDAAMSGSLKPMDLPERAERIRKVIHSRKPFPKNPRIGPDQARLLEEKIAKY